MLYITVPATDLWDERSQRFLYTKETTLQLEHSLVSLSKWESKWCKPFLAKGSKTVDETIDYIKCMTLTQNVDPNVYLALTVENVNQIEKYIEAPMTATTFRDDKNGKSNSEQITAELIYYWMIALNVPFECQKWHLNRLLTLIKVCSVKNSPGKKTSQKDLINKYADINARNKARFKSKG